MLKVKFYEIDSVDDKELRFVVIMTKYKGQWIYVRHRNRNTWEIPGGHRENNENMYDAASRELTEETGAMKFSLTPLCIYSVQREEFTDCTESYGQLFYSEVEELSGQLLFEIGEVKLFDHMPEQLTYPLIQPFLHQKAIERIEEMNG